MPNYLNEFVLSWNDERILSFIMRALQWVDSEATNHEGNCTMNRIRRPRIKGN